MQYKKKIVNDKILEAGRNEYAQNGYRGGNISTIAENAGVPVGNLYRYFDGKSGLLDAIVKPAYTEVPKMLSELQQVEVLNMSTLEQIMPMLSARLLDFFGRYRKEILILVDNCATTRYEDFATDIVRKVSDIIEKKLYPYGSTDTDRRVAGAIAKAFMNSLFDLLRLDLSSEQMQQMMERLIKFYFYEVENRR